jgi:hypothetical protein
MTDHDWTRGLPIWLSLAAVSLIAAVASYLHALTVVEAADGHAIVAHCIPALADLTIFASSANLLDAYRHGHRGLKLPVLSIGSLGLSILVTLGANVAAGSPDSVPSWLVNVWPPVAFLLALESLLDWYRRGQLRNAKRVTPDGVPCPHGVGATLADAVRNAYEHARDCERDPVTYVDLAARFSLDRKKVAVMVTPPPPQPVPAGSNGHSAAPSEAFLVPSSAGGDH